MENRYSTRDWSTKSFLLRAGYVSRGISGEMCTYFTQDVFQMFGRRRKQKILRPKKKKKKKRKITTSSSRENRLNRPQKTSTGNGTNNTPEPMNKYYHIISEYYQFSLSVIRYVELSFLTCFNCLGRIGALQRE